MTTDITELAQQELAQLRAELSNQATGSKDHLRKIALSLVDKLEKCRDREIRWLALSDEKSKIITDQEEALEKAQQTEKTLESRNRRLDGIITAAEKRIAELERQNSVLADGVIRAEQWLLESRTVTPVTYSENADADYCRKWAWEQVKDEVSTEDWTTGDSITYFGFFCWGWDMRRQYNEQRPVTVKLPQAVSAGGQGYQEQVERILTAAGIKVEAE